MISLFSKKSIAAIVLALSFLFVVGCSGIPNKSGTNLNGTEVKEDENNSNSTNNLEDNNNSPSQASTQSYGDTSQENTEQNTSQGNTEQNTSQGNSEQNITEKVKDYIINGQGNKPEAGKIKWSKTFLNRVDIESLYKQYIANGGRADDLESFAKYMTLNAPIPNDWQELFKKDLYDAYGENVVRLEHLEGDLYQAYVVINGYEVPYVVVSSRTGYYHG
ncbi:MAG: hypothetical protein ABRQ27_13765 [Clostridiaceae bacterium]